MQKWFALIIFLAICLAAPGPLQASRPVPRTLKGCVISGSLYTVKQYRADGRIKQQVYRIRVQNFDLTPYEGKNIRVSGNLTPGDRFFPNPASVKLIGPCDQRTRNAISQESTGMSP